MGQGCSVHGRQEIHTKFRLGKLKGRNCLEGIVINGRIILKWLSNNLGKKIWTGFIICRIWTIGGLL
jgi:hypothetical protein